MWRHFTSTTPIYSRPTLYYSGIGPYSIRLRLTAYRIGTEVAKVANITSLPATYGNTPAYGTNFLIEGTSELPKIQIDGHIDTPFTAAHEYVPLTTPITKVGVKVQSSITLDGQRATYGDVIATAMEGRINPAYPTAVDPDYFLDPYGRVFSAPRIVAFTASYVPGVPYREQFQMTLQLTKGSSS